MLDLQDQPIINCKYCSSSAVTKSGVYKGIQRYLCKNCRRKFKADYNLFYMRVPAKYVSCALDMYYEGLSVNNIRDYLRKEFGYYPHRVLIHQWIRRFTNRAINVFKEYHPMVTDTWRVDETIFLFHGVEYWMYEVLDEGTQFSLTTLITNSRSAQSIKNLMQKAILKAGKNPKLVMANIHYSYFKHIQNDFGCDAFTVNSDMNIAPRNTNFDSADFLRGILKPRIEVNRSLRTINTVQSFFDAWHVYYNYLKPNIKLNTRTPAETAGIIYTLKSWQAIVSLNPIGQLF